MRIFEHFNSTAGALCPICGTNDDKAVCLVPISGTEEGSIVQAIQVHVECLDPIFIRCPNGTAAIGMGFINKEICK